MLHVNSDVVFHTSDVRPKSGSGLITISLVINQKTEEWTHDSPLPIIIKPRENSEIRKNFFSVRVIDGWNNLPEEIKSAKTQIKNLYDDLKIVMLKKEDKLGHVKKRSKICMKIQVTKKNQENSKNNTKKKKKIH